MTPSVVVDLDLDLFTKNLRSARRGVAGGPSGMTTEHLKLLLENVVWTGMFGEAATRDRVRNQIGTHDGIAKTRRWSARHCRGRCVSQACRTHIGPTVQPPSRGRNTPIPVRPFHESRHGVCATILSLDGVGAYDSISRNAMFQGVADMVDAEKIIPFILQFYDSPSQFLWEDDMGEVRKVIQGEGGEQGNHLMPLLFSLGQHRTLVSIQAQLKEGERLFAFLDDIYVVCAPERVGEVYLVLEQQLREKPGVNIHQGKTKLWNKAGVKLAMSDVLTQASQAQKPEAIVWRGNWSLPQVQQGLKVLGVPVGHPSFIAAQMTSKLKEQAVLFERIPFLADLDHG